MANVEDAFADENERESKEEGEGKRPVLHETPSDNMYEPLADAEEGDESPPSTEVEPSSGAEPQSLLPARISDQPRDEVDAETAAAIAKLQLGDQLTRRVKKAPEIPQLERRNWLIHHHFVRREFDACKALIQEMMDDTRNNCEYALYTKGLILRQEGKIQESFDIFQQCAMINPRNSEYVKQIARSLFLLGKQKNAIEVFDEAQKLNSEDWEIHHWKGLCFFHMHNYGQAKECLNRAAKLNRHEKTMSLLGKILSEEGDYVNAIDAYKGALETNPENPDLLTTLGLLFLTSGSQQQAFEYLGRALSFNPSHPAAILAAGSMMQEHGDYDVALTKYRVAAQETPDSPQLWSNVGMCFFAKKKYVAAISCLKRANYLAPCDWKILYNLGVVHLGMSQYASAFHFLSAAINLNPKVAILYMTLAVTLTNLEDFKNAKQAYEQAANLDKRDPTIALNFAIFLLKQGEKGRAQEWFANFELRLPSVRDPKTGQLRCDPEVLESAERFRQLIRNEDVEVRPSRTSEPSARDRHSAMKPSYLEKYPFENESSDNNNSVPQSRPDTQASRDTVMTGFGVSSSGTGRRTVEEPPPSYESEERRMERVKEGKEETASVMSVSSRFPPSDEPF